MKRSMFSQLLIVFLSVALVFTSFMFAIMYINIRNTRINALLDQLHYQARDVVYLANSLQNEMWYTLSDKSTTRDYLYEKTGSIYSQFNAYTVVVTRDGRPKSYYMEETLASESLQMMPSAEEISSFLTRAMQGEEITKRTNTSSGPLFTLVVPWKQNNVVTGESNVMGIVVIQTGPQSVRGIYDGLTLQMILSALGVFLLIAAASFLLTRRITSPLTDIAAIAGDFAEGDFSKRVSVYGSTEVQDLGRAFNHMADQLSVTEQSRRDFVANISHELRSPITSIQGFAQGLLDGTVPPEDRTRVLTIILDETRRLSRLISSLLNLSRMENDQVSLAMSDFDINECARRVIISRINQLEDKNLEVETLFEEDRCVVNADPEQIQQVLYNLLDNAIKYTPTGGRIAISTASDGSLVTVHVKDNGIGVDGADAAHIFDRFYKADKAHTVGKGTGLGLAICKVIIEKHNQRIRLVSGEGGCDFEFTLRKGGAAEAPKKTE